MAGVAPWVGAAAAAGAQGYAESVGRHDGAVVQGDFDRAFNEQRPCSLSGDAPASLRGVVRHG
jgi:hypothetical protein